MTTAAAPVTKNRKKTKIECTEAAHLAFLYGECGDYECRDCGFEFEVRCTGRDGRCAFCSILKAGK